VSFDHDELGIDLKRAANLPECQACRKKSDGFKRCPDGTILCGRHFDAWLVSRYSPVGSTVTAADFAKSLREGPFKPCWDAKIEE